MIGSWKWRLLIVAILGASVSIDRPVFGQDYDEVPMPDDIAIEAPNASVEPRHAAFVGRWEGIWQNTLLAILVVESVKPPAATVVYGHGRAPSWGVQKGRWFRVTGEFDGDDLVIVSPNTGTTMKFSIESGGTIEAIARPKSGGNATEGEFERLQQ